MFQEDTQIKQRPKCAVKNCDNEGWILVGSKFVCGECAVKFNNVQSKMIFNIIEEIGEKNGNNDLS